MSLDTRRVESHYSRTRDSVLWAVLNLSLDMRIGCGQLFKNRECAQLAIVLWFVLKMSLDIRGVEI